MNYINGKVLIFTDQHFGIKNNAKNRLDIVKKVFDIVTNYVKENNIKTVISCGDIFHSRNQIDVNTINSAYDCLTNLSEYAKIKLIVGNHDSYLKNSIDINSLKMFNHIPNVEIISEVKEYEINGNRSLLVPWLGNVENYQHETFDMIFGHFDASHQYIVKSYIEDHIRDFKTNQKIANLINNDDLLKESSTVLGNSGDYIGNFVDIVKKNGTIFSGHIHGHREFMSKGRKFLMIGSPYQQNLGEKDNKCGFYVINENNSYEFHEITGIPKHIDLKLSKLTDDFDYSIVKDNIIHRIYDVEISQETEAKITQKINDWHPYEELLPDYDIDIEKTEITLQNESIELIRKSKLEYVKKYINNIDKKLLEEKEIDSDKLYHLLEDYYNSITKD